MALGAAFLATGLLRATRFGLDLGLLAIMSPRLVDADNIVRNHGVIDVSRKPNGETIRHQHLVV